METVHIFICPHSISVQPVVNVARVYEKVFLAKIFSRFDKKKIDKATLQWYM